jgi:hypothetical protein
VLYVDIPQHSEIQALFESRGGVCVSLYLPTTPLTQDAQADRIAIKNLVRESVEQIRDTDLHKRDLVAIAALLDNIVDDDEFWKYQARSLAVFATPERSITYRLPNTLSPIVEVSDRFHLKPLLRAVTFPHTAYVLVLSGGAVRVVEVSGDLPAALVKVEGLPADAASAVGKSSIADRSPSGRIQGSEGQKVRLAQYSRRVDQALRSILHGQDIPLILAAAPPLDSIYRSMNSYPHLAAEGLSGNFEAMSDADIAQAARSVLDNLYQSGLEKIHALYRLREQEGRGTTDIVRAARAATIGAVDTLLVDMDSVVPGSVDEEGRVTQSDVATAASYGVVDEIARRAYLSGARILAVRQADLPTGGPELAAILRWAV